MVMSSKPRTGSLLSVALFSVHIVGGHVDDAILRNRHDKYDNCLLQDWLSHKPFTMRLPFR
jgi:hypothetical protein